MTHFIQVFALFVLLINTIVFCSPTNNNKEEFKLKNQKRWLPERTNGNRRLADKSRILSNGAVFNESLVKFYLYTKDNPTEGQEIIIGDDESIRRSNIKPGAHLKILAHGYTNSERGPFPQGVKNEFLRVAIEDMNVITMDYEFLVQEPYVLAVENSKLIAVKGAEFLEFLIHEQIVTRDKIHIIGFSLGAQVAGMIGSNLLEPAARITALDPARPIYEDFGDADRIDATDADFVDVIHTNGGMLGFLEPRGHVDFYPNGGAVQPGCGADVGGNCAHARAPLYLAESLGNPLGFRGQNCNSWENYTSGSCIGNEYATMGYFTLPRTRGSFYLYTNSQSPFAQG